MKYKLSYLITIIWGLGTSLGAFAGAFSLLDSIADGPQIGHATPVEFVLIACLIILLSTLIFLLWEFLYVRLVLKTGRLRHFLLNFLLFVLLIPGGWLLTWLAALLADL